MAEKKNFDSEFCGNLPLHNVNLIQDYGYLLVLEPKGLKIIQASENTVEITGRPVQELVGTALSQYLDVESADKLSDNLKSGIKQRLPFNLSIKNGQNAEHFHALMHIKADYILIELEKARDLERKSFTDVFQEIKKIMAAIEQADTVQAVCELAVHEIRKISGFDGVLMYQFDRDWNGTVIAEEKDERLEPYIGQTFPASDVPKQARQLYLKNPYRLIPNRSYQPVRLYPVINPVTNSFIDLSDCNLRSVVAVHLEYMKNMNIDASMSIRVIRNAELWGLISCHHLTEKYLDYEVCSIFEWLSAVISNGVSRILDKEDYDFSSSLQQIRSTLTDRIYDADNIVAGLLPEEGLGLPDLFNATGAAMILNGRMVTQGMVPAEEAIDNLMMWVEGKSINKVFATEHLSGLYEEASEFADIASGVLVIPIDNNKGDYILCFRPEVVETIQWGGDPNQAINFEKDGKRYHPRNSFKLWKQTVKQHALPWKQQELEAAEALRSFLFEFRTKQLYN
ncbi:GAF domain-containing protein [Pedobacter heparinus]|uniref:Phytochrome central region domain protein n=1 Tax=Pedobacter heparinus (strain ATCC 13125 / DSM 2366 / CIP 104194 / JCM 7457 / NBRC 12017 / NCIMB 9290 / NRRL B-14731 / HIM 762-3) TaxID=485917 RepID=C6XVN0_PEDHD|nr:GAF domain-containing protein [Pedobacter heparinus]ACU06105.1 Phytochrome central region domain protein [Pedobacter heparinus DSM 2366]